jgi:hypothetical protein
MNQTKFTQILFSLEQCRTCKFATQNRCFDSLRLKETGYVNSQIDSDGNIIPITEGSTKSQKVQLKNALKRLRLPCYYYSESKFN